MSSDGIDRRKFLERTLGTGAALTLAGMATAAPTAAASDAGTGADALAAKRSASASSAAAAFRTATCRTWPNARSPRS